MAKSKKGHEDTRQENGRMATADDETMATGLQKQSTSKHKQATTTAENVTLENNDIPVPSIDDPATSTEKSKKRKRRQGEQLEHEQHTQDNAHASSDLVKEKKKKKSKKNKDATTEVAPDGVDMDDEPAADTASQEEGVQAEEVSSRKKSKKTQKDTSGHTTTESSGARVDDGTEQAVVAEDGNDTRTAAGSKKKKKRKDKEGAADETNPEELAEKKRKKKEEKKKKKAAAAAAGAATQADVSNDTETRARQDSSSTSPLPEIRFPPLPPPPNLTTTAPPGPDFENIDPELRPVLAGGAAQSPPQARASLPPPARGTSLSASIIMPRDPSIPPPSLQGRGESINPSSMPPDETGSSTAPKKRGRPKKVVSEAGIIPQLPSAPQSVAPALAPPASTAAIPTAVGRSSIAPSAQPPSSSAVMPSLAPPSSSPRRPAPSALPSSARPQQSQQSTTSANAHPALPMLGVNPNTAARAAMNPNFVPATLPEGTTPLHPSENTPHHQEILAVRWLSTKEMADLIEKEGLKVRTGKFSKAEDAALRLCIENYREQQGLTQEQIDGIIFAKGRNTRADYGDFWTILTRCVPDRALMSVYHHTKRLMQVEARKGPWTQEEDEKLKAAYTQHGPKWIAISSIVGRWDNDCRDRWRAYVGPNEKISKGKWSKEEEDKLREYVQEIKYEIYKFKKENHAINGEPIENEPPGGSDMFWSRVASKMKTRSRHQCRIKWNDNMRNKLLTADGVPIRWAKRDAFILIMKLDSLQLTDEDEIAWKLLPDSHWNWWSPHVLHKRWGSMKNRARRNLKNDNATYKEIIRWLKEEQDSIPRKEVKAFMSKRPGDPDNEAVNDDDDAAGEEEDGDGEEDVDDAATEQQQRKTKTTSAPSREIENSAAAASTSTAPSASAMVLAAKKKAASKQDQSQFRTNEFVNSSDEED